MDEQTDDDLLRLVFISCHPEQPGNHLDDLKGPWRRLRVQAGL